MARPTKYTDKLASEVCGYLAMGESLRKVCRRSGMPAPSTVFEWIRKYEEFSKQYTRAKEEAADMFIEDIIEIADNAKKDKIPVYKLDELTGKKEVVGYSESKNSVRRAQVQIESRKWLAMKLKPKKYGEKLDMTSNGKEIGVALSAEQSEQLIRARANRSDS